MKAEIFPKNGDFFKFVRITEAWKSECLGDEFGVVPSGEIMLNRLYQLVHSDKGDVLVLEKDNEVVGLLGLIKFQSPLSEQYMVGEQYWYILPEHRGNGMKLIFKAEEWTKDNECTHLILSASMIASKLFDKVCSIYERIGMKKFETSYIKKVGG